MQATRTEDIGARQLANIAYGAACSGLGKQMGAMFKALARVAERCVANFDAQALANTAWAFGTAG